MARHFHRELERLQKALLSLTALVEENLRKAVRAAETRDVELADRVRKADVPVDTREVEIEEECLKTLALYQPVATDLRFIVSALKVNNELERIGDFATRISKATLVLAEYPAFDIPPDLCDMGEVACRQFSNSVDALVKLDSAAAYQVCALDRRIDRYNRDIVDSMMTAMRTDPTCVAPALQVIFVARSLERVGDHATNIAEDIIYMVDGDIVRHRIQEYC